MTYQFDIYVSDLNPKQVLELFDMHIEEVKTEYIISRPAGVYYSHFVNEETRNFIYTATGIVPNVYANCEIDRANVNDVSILITNLIDNALHKIQADFIAVSNGEAIIAMRKQSTIFIQMDTDKQCGIDLAIFDMPHRFENLPLL